MDNMQAILTAYNSLDTGHGFVQIFQIREIVKQEHNISDKQFDVALSELSKKQILQLRGGDTSLLIPDEIKNSYTDKKRGLFLTCSLVEKNLQSESDIDTNSIESDQEVNPLTQKEKPEWLKERQGRQRKHHEAWRRKQDKAGRKQVNYNLTADLINQVKKAAKDAGINPSDMMIQILSIHFQESKNKPTKPVSTPPDPALVARIVELHELGKGWKEIERTLNGEGFKTKTGKAFAGGGAQAKRIFGSVTGKAT